MGADRGAGTAMAAEAGRAYLEELRVVGAVLAGLSLRGLRAPLQLPKAGGRVKVAGVQLGEVELRKVSTELLLPRTPTLRRQEGNRQIRAEHGLTRAGASYA